MEKTERRRPIDLRQAIRNLARAFALIWSAHRWSAVGMAVVTVLGGFLPVTEAWLGKLILDGVATAAASGTFRDAGFWAAIQPVLPYISIELALVTLSAAASQMRTLFEHVLHARLSHDINSQIMRHALTLDLEFFEDSEYYDKLTNARREADRRAMSILNTGFYAVQNILMLGSFAVLLFSFSPLVALVLFGASLPLFIAQTNYSDLHFRLLTWRAPEARRMSYYEQLLTEKDAAKEVKLFGLGGTLLGRYVELFWKFFREDAILARRRSLMSVGFGLLSNIAYYGAYAWVVWRAVTGAATLGDMALYLSLFRQSQTAFQGLLYQINELYESALFMSNLFGFLELKPRLPVSAHPKMVRPGVPGGIEFRDVSFKYASKPEWALRHVSLTIRAGEKIALVGANGAGKTTFIKLLTRLYDPNEGQILLDGVDLRDYAPDSLRDAIGVIFQDFVRYMATARENIGFGQVKALGDTARIERAAEKGGADDVIAGLTDHYDTMLGHWFNRGRELSGGQWQKIALGRAFMRDADILVLDEPTSALDAEREYEIFQRFRELTAGKIAILISHRFSTVRMADRIAVIDNGALAELGSHDELLALGGTYARLFNMQAEGYR